MARGATAIASPTPKPIQAERAYPAGTRSNRDDSTTYQETPRAVQTAPVKEKMVNARVATAVVNAARPTIEAAGLSVSDVIRNTFEYIARTGSVPETAQPKPPRDNDDFLAFVAEILAHPAPGAKEFDTKSDKEILGEIRWERYVQKDTAA